MSFVKPKLNSRAIQKLWQEKTFDNLLRRYQLFAPEDKNGAGLDGGKLGVENTTDFWLSEAIAIFKIENEAGGIPTEKLGLSGV